MYDSVGNDYLIGQGGADNLIGGDGIDTAMYHISTEGITARLWDASANAGDAAGDWYSGVENLSGTYYDDILAGDSADNTLRGLTGDDTISGAAGNDTLFGNEGVDTLYGGDGNDLIMGGQDGDEMFGDAGVDEIYGDEGDDLLSGGVGDDFLHGGAGNDDYSFGRGDGADTVINHGESGSDDQVLFGATIDHDQLWFERSGDDLTVSVIGTTDSVTVDDWYVGSANQLDFATTGGLSLGDASVQALVDAMAGFSPPALGETDLNPAASYYDSVSSLITSSWQP